MAPLKPRLVSFDAAGTLVDVRWTLDGFARDCMRRLGLELPEPAYPRLLRMYGESLSEYLRVNLTRDPALGELFWRNLTRRWYCEFGVDESWVEPSREVAAELMFDASGRYFRLFPDVLDCLGRLERMGLKLAVVSNWDYTLHPILESLGLSGRFECVLASLEEGWEKPDPRLFDACLNRTGTAAKHAVHVGDDMTDDVEGALAAGIRPIYLKRVSANGADTFIPKSFHFASESIAGAVITSLAELPEVLRSIG